MAGTRSDPMANGSGASAPPAARDVLQVERRDFADLVLEERPRAQSMRGFDDCYGDIVDYILRCTHRIWDERDVGLIYTHYTHNCVLYGTMGTLYSREDVVRDTIQRLVALPERRGMATQVIWSGDDERGFYTSHLVTGVGRHSQGGLYGPPTGRPFVSRTIADCMVFENRIFREWVVADQMAILRQLGLDPHAFAERIAAARLSQGLTAIDIGETRPMLGQYPPEAEADTSIAATDLERHTLRWLHEVWNRKMFGRLREIYAPTAMYHGPLTSELHGPASVIHQAMGLVGALPDAAFAPQHVCSTPCAEGGTKVAVRWVLDGHHLGHGILASLGEPTGKRIHVMGISHYHYGEDGRIVDEWCVYDELSLLMQLKLALMVDLPGAPGTSALGAAASVP